MERREKRNFSDDFKRQMVNLYNNWKSANEIIKEYDLRASTFHAWVKCIIKQVHLNPR